METEKIKFDAKLIKDTIFRFFNFCEIGFEYDMFVVTIKVTWIYKNDFHGLDYPVDWKILCGNEEWFAKRVVKLILERLESIDKTELQINK